MWVLLSLSALQVHLVMVLQSLYVLLHLVPHVTSQNLQMSLMQPVQLRAETGKREARLWNVYVLSFVAVLLNLRVSHLLSHDAVMHYVHKLVIYVHPLYVLLV